MTTGWGKRQQIGLLAGPALAVLLWWFRPTGLDAAAWSAAVVGMWMAVWWTTEALPIAATSLLPLLLFPLLGIADLGAAAAPYANPLVFLFLGGFLIALAIEGSGLHRRLALRIVLAVGVEPRRVILGFLLAAASLSMWISNTATALMMLPIAVSVATLAQREGADLDGDPESDLGERRFAVALLLAVAYGASVGGVATLVGTPTNALLAGFLLETYGHELSFASWLLLGLPLAVLGLGVVYWVLSRYATLGDSATDAGDEIAGGRALIERELRALGSLSRAERRVALVFAATALLWIVRPLLAGWLPGLSDTGVALAGALSLFVVPLDWRRGVFCLTWRDTERLPWGVLLLFGGGLSLAAAIRDTGLATALGEALGGLEALPTPLLMLALTLVVVFLTELTSNTATAAAFLPVLGATAVGMGENPLLLLVPATLAASCAFMLPVATPPNAIVYGSGHLTVPQMAHVGLVLNLVFTLLVTGLAYLLLPLVLGVEPGVVPAWAG